MKVKVLKKFRDKYTGEVYAKGDLLTITEERFKEIMQVDQLVYKVSEPCENDSKVDAIGDGFDAMSVRELREYADKAHKLTFGRNTKKTEMIETLRKMEQGNE